MEQACNLALGRLRLESAQLKTGCIERERELASKGGRVGAEPSYWECLIVLEITIWKGIFAEEILTPCKNLD